MPTNGVRALGALVAALTLLGVTACGSDRNPVTGGDDPQPSGTGTTAAAPGDSPSPTTPPGPDSGDLTATWRKGDQVTVDTRSVTAKAAADQGQGGLPYTDRDAMR